MFFFGSAICYFCCVLDIVKIPVNVLPTFGFQLRRAVQKEMDRRMEPVRLEQMRQCVLGEAVEQATAAMQEELVKTGANIKRMEFAPEILEGELMQIILGLDFDKHPKVKLDAIKAALVLNGAGGQKHGVVESASIARAPIGGFFWCKRHEYFHACRATSFNHPDHSYGSIWSNDGASLCELDSVPRHE
jgi:hypothetical protein